MESVRWKKVPNFLLGSDSVIKMQGGALSRLCTSTSTRANPSRLRHAKTQTYVKEANLVNNLRYIWRASFPATLVDVDLD